MNAAIQGWTYGDSVGRLRYNRVHLIGHSAGSAFIEAAAKAITAVSPGTEVHETFLDPYLSPASAAISAIIGAYGENADWADNYSAQDWTGGFTYSQLANAYNADVSWLDPNRIKAPYGLSGAEVALSSHGWPVGFYMETLTNTDSQWCGAGYGFPLSQEAGGWSAHGSLPKGDPPQVICGPATAAQNPNPGVAGLEAVVFGAGSYALSAGATLVGSVGFELQSLWSQLTLVRSGGVRPLGGPESTNTPAWLAVAVTVTNPVNLIQFDAAFTDTNKPQGLLSVYWNTNQIGTVDERIAGTSAQAYQFALPGTVTTGGYTLSFRLDSFAGSSSITVTNVTTAFFGLATPTSLALSVTNGAPLLQLTGAAGYTYLVQASTNLFEWTPAALLVNTNGTASFADSAATNFSRRFYRAVAP